MRRTAAVLVTLLLTAPAARAGTAEAPFQVMLGLTSCCAAVPLLLVFSLVIIHVIQDRGKARRSAPPPE